MGLERITSVVRLHDILTNNNRVFVVTSNTTQTGDTTIIALKDGRYVNYILSGTLYKKLNKAGAVWPSSLQNIILDRLNNLINEPG